MFWNHRSLAAIAFVLLSGGAVTADSPVVQERPVTVTGCIERDAAASTAVYKVVVPQPDGGSVIYQLNAPGNAAVTSAVGKTAQVTGGITIEKKAGREIKVLTVTKLEVVADGCRNDPR
jgi:hypothetical protein